MTLLIVLKHKQALTEADTRTAPSCTVKGKRNGANTVIVTVGKSAFKHVFV